MNLFDKLEEFLKKVFSEGVTGSGGLGNRFIYGLIEGLVF
jgi:hypothetical protein